VAREHIPHLGVERPRPVAELRTRQDARAVQELDVLVSRVAAGVAAGGRMIRHNVEEGLWTLADPAGNEVDIAMTTPPRR
jgi:hypothetical protein